jgi:CO/xanthine dehydrogenase Mo-binding subunit
MDDMASAAGIDPVEFRLRHLTGANNERVAAVLRAVAKQASWRTRAADLIRSAPAQSGPANIATGRGVAISGLAGTVVAQIADVEVNRSTGKVTVKKVTVAHDCGIIVNPDGVRNQIEGNIVQGCSRALMEEVNFDSAGVKNLNWNTYPIMKFSEVPQVEIVLINHLELPPMGAGEASTTAVAAAIGNAIFDAIGVRLRQVPFTPERVRGELERANKRA